MTSTDDVDIVVSVSSGNVKVNGSDPTGGSVAASAVQTIDITDSTYANSIDLSAVTSTDFTSLTGTTINAGNGADTVLGSSFADSISGGGHADSIDGGGGNDSINGGGNADTLLGGGGDDTLNGGNQGDSINGGAGNDVVDGGEGIDTFVTDSGADEVDTITGGSDFDVVKVTAGSGTHGIYSDTDRIWFDEHQMVISGVEALDYRGGSGVDEAVLVESDLVATGLTSISIDGGGDADDLELSTGGAGLEYAIFVGGDGNDLIDIFSNSTRTSALSLEVYGDGGNDQLVVSELIVDSIPTLYFAGGTGSDTLKLDYLISDDIVVYGDKIELNESGDVSYEEVENLTLNTEDRLFFSSPNNNISVIASEAAFPAITLTGESQDILVVKSLLGGTLTSKRNSSSSQQFSIDGASVDLTSTNIKTFYLYSQEVTIDGLGADQIHVVNTNYVDPNTSQTNYDGHITLTGAFSTTGAGSIGSAKTLISNVSGATLHGSFTSDNHLTIGSDKYDLQYVNDVTLENHDRTGHVRVTTGSIVTHHDAIPIPRFVTRWSEEDSLPINRSIANGNWSSASTWSLGHVPTNGELVRISAGTTVTYNAFNDTDELLAIEVAGTLTYDTSIDTYLSSGVVQVLPGGTLRMGTSTTPISSTKTATLEIASQTLDTSGIDTAQFGTGLIAFGNVEIHGSPIGTYSTTQAQTWVRLSKEVLKDGDSGQGIDPNKLYLVDAAPTGWKVGDKLVIPDTKQPRATDDSKFRSSEATSYTSDTEVVEIQSFSSDRKTITLTANVSKDHRAGRDTAGTIKYQPHVALLNRNVSIKSEAGGSTRGHTLFGGRGDVDIRYAEFKDLGRTDAFAARNTTTNPIGRYSVHFHHLLGPENPINTGYQYEFVGNSVVGSKRWAVTVHDTSYGLIADNVVYDTDGAAFIAESGNEIGNDFLNNISIKVHGTMLDGFAGLHEGGNQSLNDFARGGVGYWFRRTGNNLKGNVAADNTYGGLVITSYYMHGAVSIPDFRGANPDDPSESTDYVNNPAGTIENNEIYGPAQFGAWLAYLTGDNLTPNQPTVTFADLRIWNSALRAFIEFYHVAEVTFDELKIYGDRDAMTRGNTGVRGIDMTLYESINTKIIDSHIEGTFFGVINSPATELHAFANPTPTLIKNTTLKNYVNVMVTPTIEFRSGASNHLVLENDTFSLITLPSSTSGPYYTSSHIDMNFKGSSPSEGQNISEPSIVQVIDFNGDTSKDFQVFYKEQGIDEVMESTDFHWFIKNMQDVNIGAPAGSTVTNGTAWTNWKKATAGLRAHPDAAYALTATVNGVTGINGLVGPLGKFYDPRTDYYDWSNDTSTPVADARKVIMVTPWDGAVFHEISPPAINLHYNVLGAVASNEAVVFDVYSVSGSTETFFIQKVAPVNSNLISNLDANEEGEHWRIKAYIATVSGSTYTKISATESIADFTILGVGEYRETITLGKIDIPAVSGVQAGNPNVVEHLVVAGIGEKQGTTSMLDKGMAIVSATGLGSNGYWEYSTNGGTSWTQISSVSSTNALLLPKSALVRFKLINYTYSSSDPPPTLGFHIWRNPTDNVVTGVSVSSTSDTYDIDHENLIEIEQQLL